MRLLIDLVENKEFQEMEKFVHSRLAEICASKFKSIQSSMIFEESAANLPSPDEVVGTIEDPLVDPNFSKEYFYSREKFGDYEITLKKLGLGQGAPVVSYINGDRYEVFVTTKQAEKETKRFIKDGSYEKMKAKKEQQKKEQAEQEAAAKAPAPKPAAPPKEEEEPKVKKESVELLRQVASSGVPEILTFNDGSERVIVDFEAKNLIEIYDSLNKDNQSSFENRLQNSEDDYLSMMDFFLDRIRKGII